MIFFFIIPILILVLNYYVQIYAFISLSNIIFFIYLHSLRLSLEKNAISVDP